MNKTNRQLWALAELEGILSGIAADGIIVTEEASYLDYWLMLNNELSSVFPFSFFLSMVRTILDGGVVTTSESDELIRFIQAWKAPDAASLSNIQILIRALPTDKLLSPIQMAVFKNLIQAAYELEEAQATTMLKLLTRVLDDRIITTGEHETIMKMFEGE